MTKSLQRLLKPRSIAVFGGEWAAEVIRQTRDLGFTGEIWPVHPSRTELSGELCYQSTADLPGVPDASFVAVNKSASVNLVKQLSQAGAGGAICFASGFSESAAQDNKAEQRQQALIDAAADMPIIGPNCYGMINYLDGVALWPDQHGGKKIDSGVAIITQSSNIALNLTMQKRGLRLAYLLTAGNQAQTSIATMATAILDDPRVTALGLHIEGFSDIRAFEKLAEQAKKKSKRIVILKTGITPLARAALISHTRSLSGNDAAASAFIERLGMRRVRGLGEFVETLKVLDLPKTVNGKRVFSMSCSGGEAALVSDMGLETGLEFPKLVDQQKHGLKKVLGERLSLANPLDYHTSIWDDQLAMQSMVTAMLQQQLCDPELPRSANDGFKPLADIAMLVLDFPRLDRCNAKSWNLALEAYMSAVRVWSGFPTVIASLPENMPEEVTELLRQNDIVALCGMRDGFKALNNAAWLEMAGTKPLSAPVWLSEQLTEPAAENELSLIECDDSSIRSSKSARRVSQQAWGLVKLAVPDSQTPRQLDESTAKRWLSRFGVVVPVSARLSFADVRSTLRMSRALDRASSVFSYPVVAKGLGIAHKSEANAIAMNLRNRRELERALHSLDKVGGCLIEEQVEDAVAELLVSVVHDPVHGLLMTIGAGGINTEVLKDTVHCLLPVTRDELHRRVNRLRCATLLHGFRGKPAVNYDVLLDSLMSVQQAALQLGARLIELEINPLLCGPKACVAVDALVSVRNLPTVEAIR